MNAAINAMKKVKKIISKIIYFPISPRVLKVYAVLLKTLSGKKKQSIDLPIKRILISHLYCNLGDLILTIPLIEHLHQYYPSCVVDIAIDEKLAEFCRNLPVISHAYGFKPGRSKYAVLNPYFHILNQAKIYWHFLRHVRYGIAVVPRWGFDPYRSQYLAYLSFAPERYGYSSSVDGGDISRDILLTKTSTAGAGEHEVLRELRLLERVGAISESVPDSIVRQSSHSLQAMASGSENLLPCEVIADLPFALLAGNYGIVAPGSTQLKRNWPAPNFSAIICKLQEKYAVPFLVVGGPNEVELCSAVANASGGMAISIAGKTQLLELVRILKGAALVVGNDSGAGHLSGAMGVPTIAISSFPRISSLEHTNSPQRFRPMGPNVSVIQPDQSLFPCVDSCECMEAHCITQVSVEAVVAAAEKFLDSSLMHK